VEGKAVLKEVIEGSMMIDIKSGIALKKFQRCTSHVALATATWTRTVISKRSDVRSEGDA